MEPLETRYNVTYRVLDPETGTYGETRETKVVLWDGYSDLGSIPRIIRTNVETQVPGPLAHDAIVIIDLHCTGILRGGKRVA